MDGNTLKSLLLNPNLSETKLVDKLKEVSANFTSSRDQIGKYVLDEDMVSAYAAFFLPTNIPKFHFLMNQLSEEVKSYLKDAAFIDIGCGPGTYSVAFLEALNAKGRVHLVDSSPLMLKQAQKIISALYPDAKATYSSEVQVEDSKRVLFWGNSLNEMGVKAAKKILEKVQADMILFIEPGTKEVFDQVHLLRESLIEKEFNILYPCQDSKKCPASKNEKEWCHQVLRMTHESSIERLGQMAKIDRKIMPFIGHVYAKKILFQNEKKSALLFRFLQETKFSFNWQLCTNIEGELKLIHVEVMKKDLGKKIAKEFKKLSVGCRIEFEVLKVLKDDHLRIRVQNSKELLSFSFNN